jgi:urea transport system substrate-binding protein
VSNVDVMFGCWTSVSRKSVLPVIEELNGLLFYPVQYEGEESSKNVFYTGAAPNQQAIPAVDYYLEELGVQKFALLGTDYVYPRTTNNILEAYLISKGIPKEDIFVNYTPFGHSDWSKIVGDVVALGADGKKVGVISTINGDANIGFYKELAAAGVTADTLPVVAFSVGEEELSGLDTTNLAGHLAAWNYFMSADTPENAAFIAAWKAFIKDDARVTNDPMEAHYIGFNMWVNAVTEAGTTDVDAVRRDVGPEVPEPDRRNRRDAAEPPPDQAGPDRRDPGRWAVRHHQPDRTGCGRRLDRLPAGIGGAGIDWRDLQCGMFNTQTSTCVQLTSNY